MVIFNVQTFVFLPKDHVKRQQCRNQRKPNCHGSEADTSSVLLEKERGKAKTLKPTLLSITSNMVSLTEVKMQFYQISDKNAASPGLRESPAAADNTLFTHILSFGYITHTVWMSASVLLFVSFIGLLNTWLTKLATEPTTGKIKERLFKNFKI